jgi:septal ring factor EnvC (AmiA/AmiB activator)
MDDAASVRADVNTHKARADTLAEELKSTRQDLADVRAEAKAAAAEAAEARGRLAALADQSAKVGHLARRRGRRLKCGRRKSG